MQIALPSQVYSHACMCCTCLVALHDVMPISGMERIADGTVVHETHRHCSYLYAMPRKLTAEHTLSSRVRAHACEALFGVHASAVWTRGVARGARSLAVRLSHQVDCGACGSKVGGVGWASCQQHCLGTCRPGSWFSHYHVQGTDTIGMLIASMKWDC